MILILGGTTEGRVAVRVADEAAATYYYSTKGTLQSIECAHGIRLTGAMNAEEMECFCRDHAIKLLIDAAHLKFSHISREYSYNTLSMHLNMQKIQNYVLIC